MDETYCIQLAGLSCKIGYKYLLKDIAWQIKAGEHWVVFGMNGSGKTTLLSIVAGFGRYTAGSLTIFGEPVTAENIMALRKRISWVSASFFDKYYTREAVLDIVLSGKYSTLGIMDNISTADRKRGRRLLEALGLQRQADYTFDMLSKGERQNVLIARALFADPEVLILDEPCTGLDIYNRAYLFQALERLAEKQLTIIYVTHYAEEILPMFEHCLLLKNGHVFANGLTTELFQDHILSEFLEHPVCVKREAGQLQLQVTNAEDSVASLVALRGVRA